MATTPADLDDRGFVQVLCSTCNDPAVWLRCNQCDKSDHFLLADGVVSCSCGATYAFATCLCSAQVPPAGTLQAVPFAKGPRHLADLELAWGRLAAIGVIALTVAIGAWWYLAG